ncbi:SRPBCC domain-containing protein [Phytohabitans suffuscus]|uniref:Activator of Hsp90 ATPase homologue 1/2-like C-terminal domain-containing protein n=1 Tax=Phytohabitans suffuscus TaxID=624315 RepID=A0A6F8YQY8_9ACTN|nr:SRPBCC domain-containing protein [Phytohabitans suffuscus]BCB88504.1 hypothetical protein Psuf_058170 [Phytohabitans suffuscus]
MTDDAITADGPPRAVRTGRETERGSAYGAVSRRRFDAPIEDVWSRFTDPERLRRWNPDLVTGEFRLGGEFSVKDNAGGRILRCEPPRVFRVSWIFEDNYSELEVRLGPVDGGGTVVEIEHLMRAEDLDAVGMSLPDGLAGAGNGWDLTLDYLGRYLRGELDEPPTAHGDWEPTAQDLTLFSQYEMAWQKVAKETLDDK